MTFALRRSHRVGVGGEVRAQSQEGEFSPRSVKEAGMESGWKSGAIEIHPLYNELPLTPLVMNVLISCPAVS